MTGVGTALTPTLSRWERERFYLDEPDGQDWGGYGIANPCIEYGAAMTKWVRIHRATFLTLCNVDVNEIRPQLASFRPVGLFCACFGY